MSENNKISNIENSISNNRNSNAVRNKFMINYGFNDVNPIQCGTQKCKSLYSYGPMIRDFWILHFIISGKGVMINQNGVHKAAENDIFVTRPYGKVTYTADADEPWHYIWIGFKSEEHVPPILKTQDVISAPYLRELFLAACDDERFENSNTHGAYEYYLCGIIWQIFGLLLQRSPKPVTVVEDYVQPAIRIMYLHHSYDITVSDIAKRLHISKGYFSEIFKEATGVSPKKYLNDIRMEKAIGYLTQNGLSITETALSVGFPDVFAFSRAFKRHFNCSPSEYVKNYNEKKKG